MSNIPVFLFLAGLGSLFIAWLRADIYKRFDEQEEWMNKRFDDLDKRSDDLSAALKQAAQPGAGRPQPQ